MKSGNLATKLMLTAVVLAVLVYFGINLAAYFMDPFSTTVAYSFTSEHAVTVSGYVVREETVLEGGGSDLVYFSRAEGEKVSRGGTVAQIYDDQQALEDANTLRSLSEQLQQLTYARSLASSAQSTVHLDQDVADALVELQTILAKGDASDAGDAATGLRSAVLKRSYAFTGTEELDATIAQLEERIAALQSSTSASTTRITAPMGGLFSSLVDGYESVLTPQLLSELTPADYRTLSASGSQGAGKIISGNTWYFVTLMRESEMNDLKAGDTVTLRFQTGLDRDLSMKVERVSDEDGGQRVVVLSSEKYMNLTTLLRQQNAQIIFDSFSGIRVPRSAVRILWEDAVDENGDPILTSDGTAKQTQITGVYCLWGNTARFKPVKILWQEESYMVVVPSEDYLSRYTQAKTKESRRLRAGDEVIIAAEDLYDGKVIE